MRFYARFFILMMAFCFGCQCFPCKSWAREVTVILHFGKIYGIPAVPVKIRLSTMAARVKVEPKECTIDIEAESIKPDSVRISCGEQSLPVRVESSGDIEFIAPVRTGKDVPVSVSYESGKAVASLAPRDAPASWKFVNRFYELHFDKQGWPVTTSRLDGDVKPLATGKIVMDEAGHERSVFDELESVRLLASDAVGEIVEVTQRRSAAPPLRLVSIYRCYRGVPFYTVERHLTNLGKQTFTTPGWYYDRLRVTPGGTFSRDHDHYTEKHSTGPYARTYQWPWGWWGGRYTDACEPGKVGLGLYINNWDELTRSEYIVPGDRGSVCPGGWSPNPETGLLYVILSRVKLPPGKTLSYYLTYIVHHGDPDVTRRFGAARRVLSSVSTSVAITNQLKEQPDTLLEVAVDPSSGVIGVRNGWAEWCFSIQTPALEWMRVRAEGHHYRWDGISLGGWTGFLLRLATKPLPIGDIPGRYAQTRRYIAVPTDTAYHAVQSPYTIRWPHAKATITADGKLNLDSFPKSGEISTLDFTHYEANGRIVRESLADDMPEESESPVIAYNPEKGIALLGDLHIRGALTDDGLTPSLERKVTVGSEVQVYSRMGNGIPDWLAERLKKPPDTHLPSAELGSLHVRLVAWPAETVRLWPVHDLGYNGRKFQLGVNPLPVRVSLEVTNEDATIQFKMNISESREFVLGIAARATDRPTDEVMFEIPAHSTTHVSPWVTLRKDTFGRYSLRLYCTVPDRSATLTIPVIVRLRPIFGTWVYFRNWWQRPDFGVQRQSWARYPEDLLSHRINTIIYQKTFNEYRRLGHLEFTTFDREVEQFMNEGIRLIISADHWGAYHDWHSRNASPVVTNPKYVKFIQNCYGELMPRYDHYPHVIAWYNFDEISDAAVVNLGYDASVATGISRPVHSLFMLARNQYKAMADVKTDIWHCDPYTGDLQVVKDWARWSRKRFPRRMVFATLSGHASGPQKWRQVRQQGIACYGLGCEGIFYWMYQERPETGYWVVQPGPLGPITTPRWESIRQTGIDLELLANVDYLLERYREQLTAPMMKRTMEHRSRAIAAAEAGRFYRCRRELSTAWNEVVNACGLTNRIARPDDNEMH